MVGNENLIDFDRNAIFDQDNKVDKSSIMECDIPEAEFYDFFKDKKKECFEVDQMWAIYDEVDGMPRRYARIREVYAPGFKVRMTWLEADPDDKGVKDWTEAELPVACGRFIRDKSDKSEDLEIFSHTVEWEKGDGYASYKIYPRRGETWAVFENWHRRWSSDPEKHKDLQYKFVEVLSDYSNESGVVVSYLVKIKGFVSLFKPAILDGGNASFKIPPNEILRFSHRAPSRRTTGREREDFHAGYFELDPASVPAGIEEIRNLDLNSSTECIDAKDGLPLIEDKYHMENIRENPGVSCTMDGGNSIGGSGSPRLLNGCYEEKLREENAIHPLELTSTGSNGSDTKEIGLDPASLPTNFEETSNPVDWNLNIDIIDPGSPVSLGSLEEENPFVFKERANPDEKNFLDEGNSEIRNGSPRLSNGRVEENAGHPFEITPCGSCHAQSCDVLDAEDVCQDHTILSNNVKEICTLVAEKALGETNDLNLNFDIIDPGSPVSLGSLEEENPFVFKERANPDEKNFLDEGNSEIRNGSPRLSIGRFEENAGHPFEITPCGSCHAQSCDVLDAEDVYQDHTILSSNAKEMCIHVDEKAPGETNGSSKSSALAAGGRLLKRKKRKKPDVKGSPRLSNGGCKKKHCKENASHLLEKNSSDSHLVENKNKLEIYPRKGEVWALYRSEKIKWPWSNSSAISDVVIVEVLEDNVEMIKVLVLNKVASAKTVYKCKKRAGNNIIAEITRDELHELHKCSHKISVRRPSMTGLQECWELDVQGNSPVEDALADENKGRKAVNESESIVCSKDIPDSEFLEFMASCFNDFDLDRKEDSFAVGQIWAFYDRIDGMPRAYGRIEKVYSPSFMVKITSLKADLDEPDEIDWVHEDMSITCGKFKLDKTLKLDDPAAFSHRVDWEIGLGTGSHRIYPRKGETWALFKNVDNIKRSSDPINTKNLRYEFVEILSDYSEESGVNVAYLVKIKGFVSLFMKTLSNGMDSIQITPDERLKFSHRVPSFRTTGKEREDIPEGYFELGPASLPSNLEDISESEDLQVNIKRLEAVANDCSASPKEGSPRARKKRKTNGHNRKSPEGGNSRIGSLLPITPNKWCNKKKRSVRMRVGRSCSTLSSDIPLDTFQTVSTDGVITDTGITVHRPVGHVDFDPSDIPDAEFYSSELELSSAIQLNPEGIPEGQLHNFFRDETTREKLKPGQVWALYCDLDDLPKYYVQVKTVEMFPELKVEVNWLQSCAPQKGLIRCNDEHMPVSCGVFEVGEADTFNDTAYFSHQLTGVSKATGSKFEIFPRKDEVWALYKNFSSSMSSPDLRKYEYDMVLVVEEQVHWMIVLVLQKFSSCVETVFMPKLKAGHLLQLAIPRYELLRFSHQVPAFRLSDEKYGSLRGSWVLDSDSMPRCLISSN
ncbi:hypothetical protein MKW94_020032 [Papaver nudicaule]|uniref:DUF3444 domain-containing protein n=1 Tax=Papaver nudicaule TaxID=74823 RepID=A0AA42B3Y9_PAPNU|nr:hypothetical protein [Papaver nudicaule]